MATFTKARARQLAENRPTAEFPIPGVEEDTARIRKVSIAEYRALVSKHGEADTTAIAEEFLAMAWVDENNRPLFEGDDGRALLADLPGEILLPLFKEGFRFSNLDVNADGEAEKNS
jgi:hypothetical protein